MGNNYDPVTLHKYLYANADPANNIDPTGNFSIGGMMSAINVMGTLSTVANTTYDAFQVATGEKDLNFREIGTNLLWNMVGNKLGGLFKIKGFGKGGGKPKLSTVGLWTKIKLRLSKYKPTQSAKKFNTDYINDLTDRMKSKSFNWGEKKIIVDKNGLILDGHHHFVAATKAGINIPKTVFYVTNNLSKLPARSWLEVLR
jgi:hypothetical protein